MNRQPQPQRQITMRKINQEIAVRVPVPAAAPLSTRRDPNAGLPPRCVWGLAGQSLGSAGPWQGRGSGMNLGSGGTSTSATERFHTPRWPCVPTRLATRTLPPPGLLAGPLSLHLGASLSVSALISPSLSFDCPLLQARAPGPHRGCSPDAQTTAGQRPDPERTGDGKAAAPRCPSRGGSGRRKPEDLLASRPQPPLPGSNLPEPSDPYASPIPLPIELLKFATCSPSRREGSARGSRDSPPGCRRRCPVPGDSRFPERRKRTRRAGGGAVNGAAAQERSPALGSALRCSPHPGPRPPRSGSSRSRWTRGRPARLRGAGFCQRSSRSN